MPAGVTVPMDSEEAKAVEEANRRYSHLLATKAAADRYTDTEAQTLNLMTKNREVQAGVLVTASAGCQADNWDIDDTYRMLDEVGARGKGEGVLLFQHAGGRALLGCLMPNCTDGALHAALRHLG